MVTGGRGAVLSFWPLLIWFFLSGRRRVSAEGLVFVVIASSFALAALTVQSYERFAFYHLPARAWELAIGGALAVPSFSARFNRLLRPAAVRELAAWTGLACIAIAATTYSKSTVFPGPSAAIPVLGAALAIAAGAAGPTYAATVLSWRPLVMLGLISYSVYLWHWPLIIFAKLYTASPVLSPGATLLVGGVSIAAGWLTWRFIEQPARKATMSGGRGFAVYGGGAVALIALALVAGASKDWEPRFQEPPGAEALIHSAQHKSACLNSPHDVLSQELAQACTFGPKAPAFDALLWGDSHASHYLPAIRHWAASNGLTIRVVAYSGCPPFLTDYRYIVRGKERGECGAKTQAVRELIEKQNARGGLKYVFFGLRFSTYFRQDDRFAGMKLIDAQSRDGKREDHHISVERNMRRTIAIVQAMGATAVVLGEAPRLARDPENCVRRAGVLLRRLAPLDDKASCGKLNDAFNSSVKALSDTAMRRAATQAGGVYFDAATHITNGFANGLYLYQDDNHLTRDGAMHLLPHMRF